MDTTNYRTNPESLAHQMGIRIRTAVTPSGWWGVYDHPRRLITLRPGMASTQARCTLMHELGHAHYGHEGVTGKQEMLADRWAAYRLLRFEDVRAAAASEVRTHEVACSLGVLPSVLKTYMMLLTRNEMLELRSMAAKRAA